jgi:23S rRNA A1618 N6-methylase RlmF
MFGRHKCKKNREFRLGFKNSNLSQRKNVFKKSYRQKNILFNTPSEIKHNFKMVFCNNCFKEHFNSNVSLHFQKLRGLSFFI